MIIAAFFLNLMGCIICLLMSEWFAATWSFTATLWSLYAAHLLEMKK